MKAGAVKVCAGGQEAGIRFSDSVDGNGSGRTGSIAIVLREGVKYKTNMKCSDCVDKVKSQLNDLALVHIKINTF